MKRLCASLSFVAAIATVAVLAVPAQAAPDIARGSGKVLLPTVTFGVLPAHLVLSAKSDPVGYPFQGTNAQGHFRTFLDASACGGLGDPCLGPHEVISGIVTCLNVVQTSPTQTTAVVGGMVTSSSQPDIIPPGSGSIAEHVDNGQGANSPPDTVVATPTGGGPPLGCPPAFAFPGLDPAPLLQGNWEIKDRSL
jgi:hypothetical protein